MRLLPLYKLRGQAMTEFVVSVGFIFIVLFVAVPLFGKLMDIKFQNLQAARYVAWERTVWLQDRHAWNSNNQENSDDFVISNAEFQSVAVRNNDALSNSVQNRFFYGHGRAAIKPVSNDDLDGASDPVGALWNYTQSGQPMLGKVQVLDMQEQQTPGVAYTVMNILGGAVNTIAKPINFLMNL